MDYNSPRNIKYRRAQNTLIIAGLGIILMSVWTAMKTAGILVARKSMIVEEIKRVAHLEANSAEVTDNQIFILVFLFMSIYLLVAVALQVFIGYCAYSEARGKRHYLYLPMAILLTLRKYDLFLDYLDNINHVSDKMMLRAGTGPFTILALTLIELTGLILVIDMLVAALMVKAYRRQEKKEKQEEMAGE